MHDSKKKVMKDISLNEIVAVEMPAHAWIGFISAYSSTRWQSDDARAIAAKALTQLLDPVYRKEQEAAMQRDSDIRSSVIQGIFTGKPPEMPPSADDLK